MLKYCPECGKEIVDKRKFCSNSCCSAYTRRNSLIKKLDKERDEILEISKRPVVKEKEKEWLGVTEDGYYYTRELDVTYGKLLQCEHCGKKFYIDAAHKKLSHVFCCMRCFQDSKHKHVKKICLECGKEFDVDANDSFTQFCSSECENKFNRKIDKNKLPALINLRQSICINCGKDYWNITNKSIEYCSLNCKKEFREKKNLKEAICEYCGKKFLSSRKAKCCSRNCASKLLAQKTGFGKTIRPKGASMLDKKRTKISREKQSKSMVKAIQEGKFNPGSVIMGHFKGIPHLIRSTWEANFALILMYLKREYQFEEKYFEIEDGKRYLPDFYDVKRNIFYEIKGLYREDAKEKIEQCLRLNKGIKIHVIDRKKYVRIVRWFGKKIRLIEGLGVSKRNCIRLEDFLKTRL